MSLGTMRGQRRQVDEENPYWISFSDIMAGLLVVFVLASLALILELTQTRAEIDSSIAELAQAEQQRRELLHEVQQELAAMNIRVEIADNDSVLRIPEDTLNFSSNEHEVSPAYRDNVLEIGRVLHAAIVKGERYQYLDTVFVEGHTDHLQTTRYFQGNWGLSAYRAISVWTFWNDNLTQSRLDQLTNRDGEPLFSVSGYGPTRPVTARQDSAEQRRQNRRIDLRFTVVRPELERYEELRRGMR